MHFIILWIYRQYTYCSEWLTYDNVDAKCNIMTMSQIQIRKYTEIYLEGYTMYRRQTKQANVWTDWFQTNFAWFIR